MKSWLLSFESHPFPRNSSIPPDDMVAAVDEDSALRSKLLFAAGFDIVVPSRSVAEPTPTLSTTVVPESL